MISLLLLLLLTLRGVDSACRYTLPSIQLLGQLTTANPPNFMAFNVPLFHDADDDCRYLAPAKPITSDGQFVPSVAVGSKFGLERFVDSTGNDLGQDSLQAFLGFVSTYFGLEFNETALFDSGLVVCTITIRGGEKYIIGGNNPRALEFGDALAVDSYQCCIDYNGNNCADPRSRRRSPPSRRSPSLNCPSVGQVRAAIDSYVKDVAQVNDVIDNHSPNENPGIFQEAVSSGLFFETDETTQLEVLDTLCAPIDGAQGAFYAGNITTVRSATQQVLGAITNIQQGVATAQENINAINHARCCTILPGLDYILSTAALTMGITDEASIKVPRPQACKAMALCQ